MQREGILVANLRFATHAEIDEHDAPMDIDVLVLSGAGYVSVDGAQAQVRAGQTVRWPAGKQHKLWTTTTTMETIMVERLNQVTDD
ncbi:MAG: cupin domain-containing protein [Pseudomonadota bacterium]